MNNNYKNKLRANIFQGARFESSTLLFLVLLILMLFSSLSVVGQSNVTPSYEWLDAVSFGTVTQAETSELTIAIATDSNGNIYRLTFGDGVLKYNSEGVFLNKVINSSQLNDPLDIALDSNDNIYVIDYEDQAPFTDNGKIKIFNPLGVQIDRILTSYFRPLGLTLDNEDNIYVVIYNDGSGAESTISSELRVYNTARTLIKKFEGTSSHPLLQPYRIGVDSQKNIYISHTANNGEVIVFNSSYNYLTTLTGMGSPGSVVIDEFDFIHVIDYSNKINFSQLLNYNNLTTIEAVLLALQIQQGINDKEFGIRIYDKNRVLKTPFFKNHLELPVDIAFNICDRMYIDNANITELDFFRRRIKIEFELEIFNRTPSFDTEKPVLITCPTDITTDVDSGKNYATVTFNAPTATDNCSTPTVVQTKGPIPGSQFQAGSTTEIEFTATDASGNTQTCSFIVKIAENSDSEKPVFTPCPSNIPRNVDPGKCGAVVTFSIPTATDNSGETPTITRVDNNLSLTSGSLFPVGSTLITFRATDTGGNFSECSFTIIVTDNEKPVVSCPTSISETVAFGETGKIITYTTPTFDDNCSGSTILQTAGLPSGSEFQLGTTTNTFVVTDVFGNTETCSFDVTISESSDTEKPLITCPALISKNVDPGQCGAVVVFADATATDNSGAAPTITRVDNTGLNSGDLFPVGPTTISFRATDGAGNFSDCSFTITVTDNEKPTISCPASISETVAFGETGKIITYTAPTFADNCSGSTILQTDGLPSGSEFLLGTTINTFVVTDASGNTVTCSFDVIITESSDTEKPVINCPAPISKNVDPGQCGAVVVFADATATDNSGVAPTITRVDNTGLNSGDIFPVGQTIIIFKATDGTGNTSDCSFIIMVTDNEDPTISCPANISETVAFGATGKIIDYTAPVFDDNCPVATIRQTAGLTSGSEFPIGTTTNTFLVTDSSGNTATCGFTVTITESTDTEKPIFTSCQSNIVKNVDLGKCGAAVTFSIPTATDNSGETPTVTRVDTNSSLTSGSLFPVGSTQIIYRATDASGNFSECSFTILVSDNVKPTFECPENITANFDASEGYSVPDYSTLFPATDNCDSNLIYTQNPSANTVITEAGDYPITLSAKDANGNVGTCSFVLMLTKSDTFLLSCNGFFNLEADENCKFIMPDLSIEYSVQPSAASVSQSIPIGQEINADTNVTITATYNGEVQTCVIKVSLVDYEYPEIQNCPQIQTITLGNNEFYTIPDFTLIASATDNCEIQSFTQNLTVGSQIDQSEQVVLSATDNFGNTTTCAFNLIINNTNPVNQAPVANNNTFNTNEETLLSVPAPGVLENDTDADNDVLTAILQTSTSNGNLTLNSDGSFTYTPNTGFTGEDSFTYVANDGTENSNTATVTIKVNPINPTNTAPVSIDDIYSTLQNISLTVPATNGVLSNDYDAEGDQLNATLITDVSFGTLTLNPDGSFVYIPFADFSGADFFTYSATDGNLDSNLATARIEVIGVSDITVTCKEAISLELDVNGNASLNAGDLFILRPADLQFSVSKDTFTCADLGENEITLSYNNSQIQGSCQIKVTITDTMAPIIKVKPLTIALNNFGSITITPEMLHDGTTDNCSDLSFSLSKSTFGCKELGENTVIFTATDSSGNVSSESVVITVTGNCEIVPEPGADYIFIYPNPTSGPFQFATPNGVTIERVEAFDFRGRMILFKDFSAGELQYAMDLSGVQNAVYILKVYTSEGISIIRVIIN